MEGQSRRPRVAIGCQGGGSHTAFTAGALVRLLRAPVDVVALSGTSGGAICALLAWYGLIQDDREKAAALLHSFWRATSASSPWDQLMNGFVQMTSRAVGQVVAPEINPYLYPAWGQERLRKTIEEHVDFERVPSLLRADSPRLVVSAVEVRSGEFHIFKDGEVDALAMLATTAVPTLFPAVRIGERVYWDGLFSQNPPVRELVTEKPDEIWVVQINPRLRSEEPQSMEGIRDRRNQLAGNLSLEQELHPIETINRLLAAGKLEGTGFKPIKVRRLEMLREYNSMSKLDRDPGFISDMFAYGEQQAEEFLARRAP